MGEYEYRRHRRPRGGKGKHRGGPGLAGIENDRKPEMFVEGAAAHHRVRAVYCGKKRCSRCPHAWYLYLVWREGPKLRERYLGTCQEDGTLLASSRGRGNGSSPGRGGGRVLTDWTCPKCGQDRFASFEGRAAHWKNCTRSRSDGPKSARKKR